MGQSADPSLGVVQSYSYTASQANRDQDVLGDSDPEIGDPYHQLPAFHAARR